MAYTYGHMYVMTFRMTFLSVTHHIRMYVLTYFVRIDPQSSLTLIRSAIILILQLIVYNLTKLAAIDV